MPVEAKIDHSLAMLRARHIMRLKEKHGEKLSDQYSHVEGNLALAYLALRVVVDAAVAESLAEERYQEMRRRYPNSMAERAAAQLRASTSDARRVAVTVHRARTERE